MALRGGVTRIWNHATSAPTAGSGLTSSGTATTWHRSNIAPGVGTSYRAMTTEITLGNGETLQERLRRLDTENVDTVSVEDMKDAFLNDPTGEDKEI